MKLVLQIELGHDLLDVAALVRALPQALQSVSVATAAGVAETGPDGMIVQPPGISTLVTVRFRMRAEETTGRIADLPVERALP